MSVSVHTKAGRPPDFLFSARLYSAITTDVCVCVCVCVRIGCENESLHWLTKGTEIQLTHTHMHRFVHPLFTLAQKKTIMFPDAHAPKHQGTVTFTHPDLRRVRGSRGLHPCRTTGTTSPRSHHTTSHPIPSQHIFHAITSGHHTELDCPGMCRQCQVKRLNNK